MNHRLHICPKTAWELGRDFLVATLKQQGMLPTSRVLDVGCGCLRIGKPLIEFLNPNGYAGVEPCIPVLHAGITQEMDASEVARKNPVFLYSPEFDFTPLNYPFTHVLASDLFIHCSDRQLALFLDRLKPVVSRATKVIITVNVAEKGFALAKDKPENTPEEKAEKNKFLYAHADNNTTVHGEEDLSLLIATAGYAHKTLASFPLPNGNYVKHVKLITRL